MEAKVAFESVCTKLAEKFVLDGWKYSKSKHWMTKKDRQFTQIKPKSVLQLLGRMIVMLLKENCIGMWQGKKCGIRLFPNLQIGSTLSVFQ